MTTLDERIAKLPKWRRRRIEKRSAKLIAQEKRIRREKYYLGGWAGR